MEPAGKLKSLTIAIVGFGNFGQFLAKAFVQAGHRVVGSSRTDYQLVASQLGCVFEPNTDELLTRYDPDVLVLATSILSTEQVLSRFPTEKLTSCLVVDVLSVKVYARELMLRYLPTTADILATHPMFGPESGRASWQGLPFVFERVRIRHRERCEAFLDIFRERGCSMVEMSCQDHDHYAASTQFITHTTGRMLAELKITSTPINTRGFESLLAVVETTVRDSFDLYYGLYRFNPNAKEELNKMLRALETVRSQLEEYDQMHQASRNKHM
jgi:prephenate dehydrogenase